MKRIVHLAAALTVLGAGAPALAQNADQIARVRAGADCKGCNLFQADFSGGLEIKGRDLSGARLRQANLSLSIFTRSRFRETDLRNVDAYGALFGHADFRGSDLREASLVGAYFEGADLTGAKLQGANLSGAELERARGLTQTGLNSACGDESTKLPSGLTIPHC